MTCFADLRFSTTPTAPLAWSNTLAQQNMSPHELGDQRGLEMTHNAKKSNIDGFVQGGGRVSGQLLRRWFRADLAWIPALLR